MARPDFRATVTRRLSEERELGPSVLSLLSAEGSTKGLGVRHVPVDRIEPNPNQPRTVFEQSALDELAASVREHGILQPVLIRPFGGPNRYQLVAGERRWRAAQAAGLKRIPAIVRDLEGGRSLEVALVENIQRKELNAMEEAHAYRVLAEDFGISHELIAKRVGKDRATISNTLRLLKLPDSVQQMVSEGKLSAGQARALLPLEGKTIGEIALRVVREGLNVRRVEELVKRLMTHRVKTRALGPPSDDLFVKSAAEKLQRALLTKVTIEQAGASGRICIHYHSADELTRLYDQLIRAGAHQA